LYNAQDWRSYDSSIGEYPSDKNTQNGVVFLYKKVSYEPAIVADAISVPATYTTGEATYTVKNMESDDVTATFATEWISTEAANGVITYEIEPNYTGAVRNGKITLSSAKYGITKDVTVTQAADQFKVSATSVSLKSEANSTATFTVTSTYAATIAVADATKWSVTPTSVAGGASAVTVTVKALTANATTEAITGAITITRTEDSKKLTVTASQAGAGGSVESEEVTETLSIYANKGSLSNKVITWTGTNFIFSNAQGSSTSAIRTSDTDHYRIYANSTITFTAKNGKKFKKIVITCTGSSYATPLKNALGANATVSGSTVTWTGSAETITGKVTAQSRINKIVATLQ
jgi:hypothetical protein